MSRREQVGLWAIAPIALLALSWHPIVLAPGAGLDQSWHVALELALARHLHFGTQVIFTSGPLGFLDIHEIWRVNLAAISFAYTVSLRLAAAAAVFAAARATFGTAIGFLASLAILSVAAGGSELVLALGFGVWALRSGLSGRRGIWMGAAAGAFVAVQCLAKISIGGAVFMMVVILGLSLPGPRHRPLLAAGGAFLVTLLVLWGVTGQNYGTLPQYVLTAVPVVAGYSAAMQLSNSPALGWEMSAALFGLAFGLWVTWEATAPAGARLRRGAIALWIVVWFSAFKEGFVRADPGHTFYFFSVLLAGVMVLRPARARRTAAVVGLAALLVFASGAHRKSLQITPGRAIRGFTSDLRTFADLDRARAIQHEGFASVRAQDTLDGPTLALLRGHTVAVVPDELVIAWAYGLDFDPLPVLQSYAAYTSRLDTINADFLRSRRAPERILYQGAPALDGRVGVFDEAETLRTMFCRYRVLRASPPNLVLGHATDRCSAPRKLETVRARLGQAVSVPRPATNALVSVRISGLSGVGLSTLGSVLYKPPLHYISLNGGSFNRLIVGTAGDGLPLLAGPGSDWPAPFAVAAGASTLAVFDHPGTGPSTGTVTFSFFSQSVS